MNVQSMMSKAKLLLNKHNSEIKVFKELSDKEVLVKEAAEKSIHQLGISISEVKAKNNNIEIFSKEINQTAKIGWQECVNHNAVGGDPYGRSSDYEYEPRKETLLIEKVIVVFSANKEHFYDPGNFLIKLVVTSNVFDHIILSKTDLSITGTSTKPYQHVTRTEWADDTVEKLKKDSELKAILSFLHKKI